MCFIVVAGHRQTDVGIWSATKYTLVRSFKKLGHGIIVKQMTVFTFKEELCVCVCVCVCVCSACV